MTNNQYFIVWWFSLILVVYIIYQYNLIIQAKNSVEEMYSSIDVALKNRHDLIPNLVETIKWYMKHEAQTLLNATKERTKSLWWVLSQKNMNDEAMLSEQLSNILVVAESYPDLKASTNFLQLQFQIAEIEDRLQAVRRAYNASIKELRNFQEQIPTNIISKLIKIPIYPYFEANEEEKKNVNISFW